jgi:hypothetical protein
MREAFDRPANPADWRRKLRLRVLSQKTTFSILHFLQYNKLTQKKEHKGCKKIKTKHSNRKTRRNWRALRF